MSAIDICTNPSNSFFCFFFNIFQSCTNWLTDEQLFFVQQLLRLFCTFEMNSRAESYMNTCQNQTHESLTSVIAEILVMRQYKMDKWATSEKSK